jgi:RNA polymerase sigma-70 factor (ECF subfamily)
MLVQRSAEGDEGAFRALVERYQGEVYNLALRFLGDASATEEVTQDAFIRLFRSLPGFRFEATLSTWLHRVTLNLCRDRWRKSDRATKEVSLDEIGRSREFASTGPAPDHEVMTSETQAVVQTCLLQLPEEHREVVLLRYINDLSYKEIAESLGLSAGTVASRLHRGMSLLSDLLAPTREGLSHE